MHDMSYYDSSDEIMSLSQKLKDIDILIDYFTFEQLEDIEAILENIVKLITKESITDEERSAVRDEVLQRITSIEEKNCLHEL